MPKIKNYHINLWVTKKIRLIIAVAFLCIITAFFYVYEFPLNIDFFKAEIKDQFITIESVINKSNLRNKVIYGSNGWLFYFREVSTIVQRWNHNENNYKAFNIFNEHLKKTQTSLILVPVPNKAEIYSEKIFANSEFELMIRNKRRKFFRLFENSGIKTIDLFDLFMKTKEDSSLYYKTDTHWNSFGKMIAATEVSKCNFFSDLASSNLNAGILRDSTINMHGDLQNMLLDDQNADTVVVKMVVDSFRTLMPARNNSEILIIGDSFAGEQGKINANFGAYLSYLLHQSVDTKYSINSDGNKFVQYAQKSFNSYKIKPKIVVLVFSSRKLLWDMNSDY